MKEEHKVGSRCTNEVAGCPACTTGMKGERTEGEHDGWMDRNKVRRENRSQVSE